MKTSNCRSSSYIADRAISAALECQDILEDEGIAISDCIACGTEGCVFQLIDGNVVKITTSEEEAAIAVYLRSQKQHPNLPKIYSVWEMPNRCSGYDGGMLYAIVREDIPDFPKEKLSTPGTLNIALIALGTSDDEEEVDTIQANADIDPKDAWVLDQMADLYRWLLAREIKVMDLHKENIGYKRGKVILRDFGYSNLSDSGSYSPEVLGA